MHIKSKLFGNSVCLRWDADEYSEFEAMLRIVDDELMSDDEVSQFNDAAEGFRVNQRDLDACERPSRTVDLHEVCDVMPMILNIQPFPFVNREDCELIDECSKKVVDAAIEVRASRMYEINSTHVLYELADTITAAVNMAYAMGYDQKGLQRALEKVKKRNIERGRYDG